MSETKEKSHWTDRIIHIAIVAFVVTGMAIPVLLKTAEQWLGWVPPPAIQSILNWLPPY